MKKLSFLFLSLSLFLLLNGRILPQVVIDNFESYADVAALNWTFFGLTTADHALITNDNSCPDPTKNVAYSYIKNDAAWGGGFEREFAALDISSTSSGAFQFYLKGDGTSNSLRVRLSDDGDATEWRSSAIPLSDNTWHVVELPYDLSHFTNGAKTLSDLQTALSKLTSISFLIYSPISGTGGTIYIDKVYSGASGSLPVELTSFVATINKNAVSLKWQTATELNNYGFEIERRQSSIVNSQWGKVGFVNGNGNSSFSKEYSFTDKTVSTGKFIYRLKQIDNDGKYEYSKEVEADLGKPTTFALNQNYPNPFNPTTVISYQLPQNGFVSLKVYNAIGTEVATLINGTQETGTYNVQFPNTANLSSGIYFYTLRAGDFVQTKKMIFIK